MGQTFFFIWGYPCTILCMLTIAFARRLVAAILMMLISILIMDLVTVLVPQLVMALVSRLILFLVVTSLLATMGARAEVTGLPQVEL